MRIILASASPRRRELLQQIGLEYEVLVSDAQEIVSSSEPEKVVEELARQKAENVYHRYFESGIVAQEQGIVQDYSKANTQAPSQDNVQDNAPEDGALLIISADTIVACDGRILGKPKDTDDAKAMLRLLQGRSHEVYTGVSFLYCGVMNQSNRLQGLKEVDETASGQMIPVGIHSFHEATKVHFYPMTEEEIEAYVATGDPLDKAGAYGIQGLCARYISGIEGDYNNVVGLPVGRLYQEMKDFLRGEAYYEKSSHF